MEDGKPPAFEQVPAGLREEILSAIESVKKYNAEYNSVARAIGLISWDTKRDTAGVINDGDAEANLEGTLLSVIHPRLSTMGLGISFLKDGEDARYIDQGSRVSPGVHRLENKVALIDISDAGLFGGLLKKLGHGEERLLFEILNVFSEQIRNNLVRSEWNFNGTLREAHARTRIEELATHVQEALRTAGIRLPEGSHTKELLDHHAQGVLAEYVLYDRHVERNSGVLSKVPNAEIYRPEFMWLENDWQKALAVFELLQAKPEARDLARRCGKRLMQLHEQLGLYIQNTFPNLWADYAGQKPEGKLEEGAIWGLVFMEKYKTFKSRLEGRE